MRATIQWDRNNKYINAVNNSRFTVSVCVCGLCACMRATIQWDRNNKYISPVNHTRFTVSVACVWRVGARMRARGKCTCVERGCMYACAQQVYVCVQSGCKDACTW